MDAVAGAGKQVVSGRLGTWAPDVSRSGSPRFLARRREAREAEG